MASKTIVDLRSLPPQDLGAEQSVLGACLLSADAIDAAGELIGADDFYSEKNRIVWKAATDLRDKSRAVDVQIIAEALEKRKQLAEIGGVKYLMDLMEAVPYTAHVRDYAAIVRDRSRRRHAVAAAETLIRGAHNLGMETDDFLADAELCLQQATERGMQESAVEIGDILADVLNNIGKPDQRRKVPSYYEAIDNMCGGFPMGGLTILGALRSVGKTALMLSTAVRVAEAGWKTLVVSYEQRAVELAERMIAIIANVSLFRMQHGQTTTQENARIVEEASRLHHLPIMLDDRCLNQNALLAMIRSVVRRKAVKVVMIDYLQLIPPADSKVNREQQIAALSRALKVMAMQMNVAVVVLSQLNRQSEIQSRKPRLSDLRESGAIEQDGDLIWLVHRPNISSVEPGKPDDHAIIDIAKQRNGPTGEIQLGWHAPSMKYSTMSGTVIGEYDGDFK